MGALFYHRRAVGLISAVAILTVAPTLRSDETAPSLPRYRLEPGQELVYKLTSTEKLTKPAEDDGRKTEAQWHVYVIGQTADGRSRLIIRRHEKDVTYRTADAKAGLGAVFWNILSGGSGGDPAAPVVHFENTLLGYCDLTPEGGFEKNSSLGSSASFQVQPEELFCQLPAQGRAPGEWWEYDGPASREKFRLTVDKADDERMTIKGSKSLPEDVNYEMTRDVSYHFDAKRGLVDKVVVDMKYKWRDEANHVRSTIELVSAEKREPEWMAAFAADAEAYLKASDVFSTAYDKASTARTRDECQKLLDEARADLAAARDAAKDAEIIAMYDNRLKSFDEQMDYELRSAKEREDLYAKPPVDWETRDIDGEPHKLVDYRGKVLVMDFWYRGCGHCIKALPKIKRLAAKYEDQPVVVMGINNDSKDEDARYVIETFELKYPTLRNGDISKSYNVSGWPSLVVLDQSGRVALFHVGNSDDLEEKITRAVDELLENPVAADEPGDASGAAAP